MAKIVGVRFKERGKVYYFDPGDLDIKKGYNVIVETARGVEFGEVLIPVSEVLQSEIVSPLKSVLRIATAKDKNQAEENSRREKEAFDICCEKILKHGLDMKLIDVEYTFDANKILFYFTSGGRVDFRELVKDLAAIFRTRIELRQIGVRDEAKMLGGLGVCGRGLCCSSFLNDFQPVSIKMAKEQNLSLNPSKISGACGRLMCCLKYEQDCYEELIRITPRVGAVVKTPQGKGVVWSHSLLKGNLKVKLDKDNDTVLQDFNIKEVRVIKDVKNRQEEDANLQELKELEK